MKTIIRSILMLVACGWFVSVASAQVSPVKIKVAKKQKTEMKETFRTTDGAYRSSEKNKSVYYTIELTKVTGSPAREFLVKWAVLTQRDGTWTDGQYHAVRGEKTLTVDFGRSESFDTEVVELTSYEHVGSWSQRSEYGARLVGYAVEVYVNDQLVAAETQPSSVKAKLEQAGQAKQNSVPVYIDCR